MMRRSIFLPLLFVLSAFPARIPATPTLSPQTFQVLQKVEGLLDKKAYDQAVRKIQKRLSTVSTPLEKALLLRALGSAYTLQGQYARAAKYLEQALATGALPDAQRLQVQYALGQIYLAMERPAKALQSLERWLRSAPEIHPPDRVLLAQLYVQLKRYWRALKQLNLAIGASRSPPEEWFELRLAIQYQLKNYPAAIADAKTLLRLHPAREKLWQQLAGLYQLSDQPFSAAAAKELEDFLGLLDKEREVLNLVSMLRAIHVPFLAASRLEKALDRKQVARNHEHLTYLATLWTEARELEHAIRTLKAAAKLAPDGETWLRLGQLYYEQGKWNEATEALGNALKRGRLKHPGRTWLLLGSAYLELERLGQSRHAFENALRYPESKQTAKQWLNYLKHLPPA